MFALLYGTHKDCYLQPTFAEFPRSHWHFQLRRSEHRRIHLQPNGIKPRLEHLGARLQQSLRPRDGPMIMQLILQLDIDDFLRFAYVPDDLRRPLKSNNLHC